MKKLLTAAAFMVAFGLFNPASAKANVLFYDPFNVSPALNGWDVSGAGSATSNGTYTTLTANQFQQSRIRQSNFSTVGFHNLVFSWDDRASSVLDNTHQTSNTGIDFSEFRWRITGESAWNTFIIGNSSIWNSRTLILPELASNSHIDFGYRLVNAGFGSDILRVDNLRLSGDPVVPEPASMVLLGSGLFGLAGLRRKKS